MTEYDNSQPNLIRSLNLILRGTIVVLVYRLIVYAFGYRGSNSVISIVAVMIFGIGAFGALQFANKGNLDRAVVIICALLISIAIGLGLSTPHLYSAFLLLPFLAVIFALPYVSTAGLRSLLGVSFVSVLVLDIGLRSTSVPMNELNKGITVLENIAVVALITASALILLLRSHTRLNAQIRAIKRSNSRLEDARIDLEQQVEARTAELREALTTVEVRAQEQTQLLDELQQQRQTIRELSVPVLPVTSSALILPLIGAMDNERIADLGGKVLEEIEERRARQVLIDITGVPVVDTFVAHALLNLVQSAHLLGAQVNLIGVRPEVAQTIVSLGIDLSRFSVYRDLQSAISHLYSDS